MPEKRTKREISLVKVQAIYVRDGRRCWHCGRMLLPLDEIPYCTSGKVPPNYPTLDHIKPKAHGGNNHLSNLVVSCPSCNARRGDSASPIIPKPGPEVVLSDDCPDCTNGVWAQSDGRDCPTCEGVGRLSAPRALALFVEERKRRRSATTRANFAKAESRRLKELIEAEHGKGSARRDLAAKVEGQRALIRDLGERIADLKVELAQATGSDLARLIPFPTERERALQRAGEVVE